MKHEQRTRVFVAGEDISKYVLRADLRREPGAADTATVVLLVDRLALSTTPAGDAQVLEIHVAEEE